MSYLPLPSCKNPRGIYLITPDRNTTNEFLNAIEPLLTAQKTPITWLQYRNKLATPAQAIEQAEELQLLCQQFHIPLIINDNIELALKIGASGVHLGEDDKDILSARQLLGDSAIIGASCYNQIDLAHKAVEEGASYVAFGAFFPTESKTIHRYADLDLLQQAKRLSVPKVAIGGLTPENSQSVIQAGADLIAIISGVFNANNPVLALEDYYQCFESIGVEF